MANQQGGPLAGKVVIVTGARGGFGGPSAVRTARDGAAVVLAARDSATLSKIVEEVTQAGGKAISFPVDLRSPEAAAAVVDAAIRAYGKIDSVVNNAGAPKHGDFFELSE